MSKLFSCSPDVEVDLSSQAIYADRFRVRYPGDSRGLPAHLDNGSIERWEDEENSQTFRPIWEGRWEDYDAWNIDHRAEAVIDLYGGPGACSVFRSLQGKNQIKDSEYLTHFIRMVESVRQRTSPWNIGAAPRYQTLHRLHSTSAIF